MSDVLLTACPRCAADLTPFQNHKVPPSFCLQCKFPLVLIAGKYRLIRVLGEGGFGTVYLAKHIHLTRNAERVVKLIKPDVFSIEGMEKRFYREVQVTSDVSQRNDHIVRIYDDFGEIPNLGHFYVMEYLEGRSLTDYITKVQQLPDLAWCFDVFRQLCEAMQAAHDEGVVHRDLKPDNLLLIQRKRQPYFLKVLDFGIAKPVEGSSTRITQGALGTPFYMSPEQGMNKAADARADIYSMASILYEMLTGQVPFVRPEQEDEISALEVMTMKLMKEPEHPTELCPERQIPRRVGDVILNALARQPEDRIQSAEDFWSDLECALEDDGTIVQKRTVTGTHVSFQMSGESGASQPPPSPGPLSLLKNSRPSGHQSLQIPARQLQGLPTGIETPVPAPTAEIMTSQLQGVDSHTQLAHQDYQSELHSDYHNKLFSAENIPNDHTVPGELPGVVSLSDEQGWPTVVPEEPPPWSHLRDEETSHWGLWLGFFVGLLVVIGAAAYWWHGFGGRGKQELAKPGVWKVLEKNTHTTKKGSSPEHLPEDRSRVRYVLPSQDGRKTVRLPPLGLSPSNPVGLPPEPKIPEKKRVAPRKASEKRSSRSKRKTERTAKETPIPKGKKSKRNKRRKVVKKDEDDAYDTLIRMNPRPKPRPRQQGVRSIAVVPRSRKAPIKRHPLIVIERRKMIVIERRKKPVVRKQESRKAAPRSTSACPKGWIYLVIIPQGAGTVLELARGKAKRSPKGGFCVPRSASAVEVNRAGFKRCLFHLRTYRRKLYIRLRRKNSDSFRQVGYCLQ